MKPVTTTHQPQIAPRIPGPQDIERLDSKAAEPPEVTTREDLRFSEDVVAPHDSSYTSELQYNGYDDIEDYDNNAYDLNVEKEKQLDPEEELNFDGRKPDPHVEEEDPIHPQES